MAKIKGRKYKYYVKTTAPVDADDPAGYDIVGMIQTSSLQSGRNAVPGSDKDSGDESEFIAGRRNHQIQGTAYFDAAGNTGQTSITTAFNSESGELWFLLASATSGQPLWHGKGIVTQLNISFPDDELVTVEHTVQVSGALTQGTLPEPE